MKIIIFEKVFFSDKNLASQKARDVIYIQSRIIGPWINAQSISNAPSAIALFSSSSYSSSFRNASFCFASR